MDHFRYQARRGATMIEPTLPKRNRLEFAATLLGAVAIASAPFALAAPAIASLS
jgi:hypothetical protein